MSKFAVKKGTDKPKPKPVPLSGGGTPRQPKKN